MIASSLVRRGAGSRRQQQRQQQDAAARPARRAPGGSAGRAAAARSACRRAPAAAPRAAATASGRSRRSRRRASVRTGRSAGCSACRSGTAEARLSAWRAASAPASARRRGRPDGARWRRSRRTSPPAIGWAAGPGAPRWPAASSTSSGASRPRSVPPAPGASAAIRRSISTNAPDSGSVDQVGVGGGVDQRPASPCRAAAGDQRRAVGEPRPGVARRVEAGLRQHLALHHDVALAAPRCPASGPASSKPASGSGRAQDRAPPRLRSPRRSVHRQQLVLGRSASRGPAKRSSTPPRLDPARQPARARPAPICALSVSDDGRHPARQQLRRSSRARSSAWGAERALDIVELDEQRLRGLGRGLADQADQAVAPALVEQHHAADAAGRLELEPGDLVAQLERQVDARPRRASASSSNASVWRVRISPVRADRAQHQALHAARRRPARGDHQLVLAARPAAAAASRVARPDRRTPAAGRARAARSAKRARGLAGRRRRRRRRRSARPARRPASASCRSSSSAAARSTGQGLGAPARHDLQPPRRRSGAAAASAPGSGAVPSRTTSRFSRCARSAKRSQRLGPLRPAGRRRPAVVDHQHQRAVAA